MSNTPIYEQMKKWHDSGVKMSTILALLSHIWMPEVDQKHHENNQRAKHNLWPKK